MSVPLNERMNSLKLGAGARIDEFSIDGTMAGNSDTAVPTEKAVRTYVASAVTTPDIEGTTNESFTVDNDSTTGKIKVQPAAGATDKTMTLTNVALTDNRTITFPNNTGTVALTSDLLLRGVRDFSMSFETGEQTTTKIYFPYKVTIQKIHTIVMKALADTDDGTVTCGNSTGASAGGVVTIAASAALNEEDTATPTTNNVVESEGYYYLTTAKSTAGGRILVTLDYVRTA